MWPGLGHSSGVRGSHRPGKYQLKMLSMCFISSLVLEVLIQKEHQNELQFWVLVEFLENFQGAGATAFEGSQIILAVDLIV